MSHTYYFELVNFPMDEKMGANNDLSETFDWLIISQCICCSQYLHDYRFLGGTPALYCGVFIELQ